MRFNSVRVADFELRPLYRHDPGRLHLAKVSYPCASIVQITSTFVLSAAPCVLKKRSLFLTILLRRLASWLRLCESCHRVLWARIRARAKQGLVFVVLAWCIAFMHILVPCAEFSNVGWLCVASCITGLWICETVRVLPYLFQGFHN